MKNTKYFFVILGVLIGLFLSNATALAGSLQPEEVGAYSLFKISEEGKDVLYKINTKTGQVWEYSEYAVMSSDDLSLTGTEKENVDKMITQARMQGKNVYTTPFWTLTSEENGKYYTVK